MPIPLSSHHFRVICVFFFSLALSLGLNLADSLTTQVLGESTPGLPRVLVLSEVNDEMVLQEAWRQISLGVKASWILLVSGPKRYWQLKLPATWGRGVLCFSREGPRANFLKVFPILIAWNESFLFVLVVSKRSHDLKLGDVSLISLLFLAIVMVVRSLTNNSRISVSPHLLNRDDTHPRNYVHAVPWVFGKDGAMKVQCILIIICFPFSMKLRAYYRYFIHSFSLFYGWQVWP